MFFKTPSVDHLLCIIESTLSVSVVHIMFIEALPLPSQTDS